MSSFCKTYLDLKYYTTIYIGGIVPWAFFPRTKDSLPEIFTIIKKKLKLPFFILGRGSNTIIQDGALNMACILTHALNQFIVKDNLVIVEAGVPMSFLSKEVLLKYSLSGLEFTYGLPGSIGGGVFMNARVYGHEFKDIVEWVEVYDYENQEFLRVDKTECNFNYKQSIFQQKPYFITEVALRLTKAININPYWEQALNNRSLRVKKHHFSYPSSGSFFKNNYSLGKSSGEILEQMNFKGFTHGEAKISEYHANFFVNPNDKASFKEMKELFSIVQKKLKEKNIVLEPEVIFISDSINA